MKPTLVLFTSAILFAIPTLHAEDAPKPAAATTTELAAAKPYPLDTCIVSDEKLGEMGEPFVFVHEGQQIKLCCKKCKSKFEKDPAKFLQKLEPKK